MTIKSQNKNERMEQWENLDETIGRARQQLATLESFNPMAGQIGKSTFDFAMALVGFMQNVSDRNPVKQKEAIRSLLPLLPQIIQSGLLTSDEIDFFYSLNRAGAVFRKQEARQMVAVVYRLLRQISEMGSAYNIPAEEKSFSPSSSSSSSHQKSPSVAVPSSSMLLGLLRKRREAPRQESPQQESRQRVVAPPAPSEEEEEDGETTQDEDVDVGDEPKTLVRGRRRLFKKRHEESESEESEVEERKRDDTEAESDIESSESGDSDVLKISMRSASNPIVFQSFAKEGVWHYGLMEADGEVYDISPQEYPSAEEAEEAAATHHQTIVDLKQNNKGLAAHLARAWVGQNKFKACEDSAGTQVIELTMPGGSPNSTLVFVAMFESMSTEAFERDYGGPDFEQWLLESKYADDPDKKFDAQREYVGAAILPQVEAKWTRLAKEVARSMGIEPDKTVNVKRGLVYCPDKSNRESIGLVFLFLGLPSASAAKAEDFASRLFRKMS